MILLIDNYDSFSYNLYQAVGQVNPDIKVVRNDELTVEEIRQMAPEALILSPGPGRPKEAGICEQAAKELAGEFPILGVCLGHQAIYEVFGGTVSYAGRLMHGKQSMAKLDLTCPIFDGLPEELKITAQTAEGEIMAVAHKTYPIYGLQFHPESILTPDGQKMIENFLKISRK